MALFNFGKKAKKAKEAKEAKEEKKAPACACGAGCATGEITDGESRESVSVKSEDILSVKVLGPGCACCRVLLKNTKEAVKNKGIDIEVDYVTDMQKIAEYGVMSVPALVVNEKVVSMGRALKTAEVEKLLTKPGV